MNKKNSERDIVFVQHNSPSSKDKPFIEILEDEESQMTSESKKERKSIYVISTFEKIEKSGHTLDLGDVRPVGWYSDFDRALDTVVNNRLDLWETIYEYAVIEKLDEGLYPCEGYNKFFKFDIPSMKYMEIPTPEEFEGRLYAFSIG